MSSTQRSSITCPNSRSRPIDATAPKRCSTEQLLHPMDIFTDLCNHGVLNEVEFDVPVVL